MEEKTNLMEKAERRGGARKGAGRKRSTAKVYQLYATQEVMDILEAVTGSKSDFICKCILHYNSELKVEN